MLTDKGLYAFKDLAVRFLRGEEITDPTARTLDLEAVDVSLGPDRSLVIVMPDSVYHIKIDSLLAGADDQVPRPRNDCRNGPGSKTSPTDADAESWESFPASPWEKSEELELTEVV
jgi:hypothetical protein